MPHPVHEPDAADLHRLSSRFATEVVEVGNGLQVAARMCGTVDDKTLPVVCLHGIGSGSASWLDMAQQLGRRTRVVAWDAPGYGASTALPSATPTANDYAQRLLALLDALEIRHCVIVGHSLGALVAAAAAALPEAQGRFAALALLSPALGYGAPDRAQDRARVHSQRLQRLDELGIAGMAEQRASRLLSDQASSTALAWVRWNMQRLDPRGYRQAIELLCNTDLLSLLPAPVPTVVACGALDVITPPSRCVLAAQACHVPLQTIDAAGHACYVEQPRAVADWLQRVLDTVAI